jgi:hypothetical protein
MSIIDYSITKLIKQNTTWMPPVSPEMDLPTIAFMKFQKKKKLLPLLTSVTSSKTKSMIEEHLQAQSYGL